MFKQETNLLLSSCRTNVREQQGRKKGRFQRGRQGSKEDFTGEGREYRQK